MVPEIPPFEIRLIRARIYAAQARDPHLLLWRQLHADLVGNRVRDLALQGEHVSGVAIEGLGPEMRLVTCLNQLGGHPQAIRATTHSTLEHIGNPELPGDDVDALGR